MIHIERQWKENLLTVQGNILHEKAHDHDKREMRGGVLITRGMQVNSPGLGISGECDVVEFHRSDAGIPLHGRDGLWQPYPVEYKHGSPKVNNADRLQLCAQGMCLEEMLCCDIPEGALFYGETRRREVVLFDPALREQVHTMVTEMHRLYTRRYTPKVKPSKSCNACSLRELCLSKLSRKESVEEYLHAVVEDEL